MTPEELLRLADAAAPHDCGSDSGPEDCPLEALADQGFAATKRGIALARRVAREEMAGRDVVDADECWHQQTWNADEWDGEEYHGGECAAVACSDPCKLCLFRQALDHEEGDEK